MAEMRRLRMRSGFAPYPHTVTFPGEISTEDAEPMLRFARSAMCGPGLFTWGWREIASGADAFETVFGFTDAGAARAFDDRWRMHAPGRCPPHHPPLRAGGASAAHR